MEAMVSSMSPMVLLGVEKSSIEEKGHKSKAHCGCVRLVVKKIIRLNRDQ